MDTNSHGVRTKIKVEDDKLVICRDQDLSAAIDYATKLRNADQYSADGIKKGWWHVGHVPAICYLPLKRIGVDMYRSPVKDIVAGLKRLNMEHLLTTRKRV